MQPHKESTPFVSLTDEIAAIEPLVVELSDARHAFRELREKREAAQAFLSDTEDDFNALSARVKSIWQHILQVRFGISAAD